MLLLTEASSLAKFRVLKVSKETLTVSIVLEVGVESLDRLYFFCNTAAGGKARMIVSSSKITKIRTPLEILENVLRDN